MKILINAVSAKLGGAATYVRNLAVTLSAQADPRDEFVFVAPPSRAVEIRAVVHNDPRIRVIPCDAASRSPARRWWWDQVTLRALLRRERPDVLFSSANFALLASPCPQVLLVRIPIYFSREYLRHILPQKSMAFRAETALRRWLVCRSVQAASRLMTPSAAMLEDLRHFARVDAARAVVNPYGVPRARVVAASAPREPRATRPRVLWVSHYADHKNLATLLRAVEQLRHEGEVSFELLLTLDANLQNGQHTAMAAAEHRLLRSLSDAEGARADEVSLRLTGVLDYAQTWDLYRQADIFVFPSLCESFGHPLVEAMASGLPIVASDIAVHREICGDAAVYFPALDPSALAGALRRLLQDAAARQPLAERGRVRVNEFIWEDHVARLLALLRETAGERAKAGAG